ncbi:hypothetical protein ABKN59_004605 [Abortiporus biennis]
MMARAIIKGVHQCLSIASYLLFHYVFRNFSESQINRCECGGMSTCVLTPLPHQLLAAVLFPCHLGMLQVEAKMRLSMR